jgi:hypothetical protein
LNIILLLEGGRGVQRPHGVHAGQAGEGDEGPGGEAQVHRDPCRNNLYIGVSRAHPAIRYTLHPTDSLMSSYPWLLPAIGNQWEGIRNYFSILLTLPHPSTSAPVMPYLGHRNMDRLN